jgi:molybdopterin converting factor subunit 1
VPVTVLYFAAARDAAGVAREVVAPGAAPWTVGALRARLAEAHPALARVLPRCRVAVDQEFAGDDAEIPDGAEVAIVPPVAGGAPLAAVVERPLALAEVVDAVAAAGMGAIATFTGTVRDASRGRRVVRLEYEAYAPMAERTLARIADEVGRAHGAAVAIVHRVGVLAPGDAAVVIAAAAPHRTPAFRACEATIERLKADAPIWKREVYEDGSEWVGLGP